jgi:uracil-DNA glycosylase
VLLISQAPGSVAHESGVPWDDRSGDRLRGWLGLTREEFYDSALVGILPMGFCYPGRGKSGDMRPRPECAPTWHPRLLAGFSGVRLTICVGRCAFERYLSEEAGSLTEAVRVCARLLPERLAIPHPSPRNNIWLKRHPWFEEQTVPLVREAVRRAVGG